MKIKGIIICALLAFATLSAQAWGDNRSFRSLQGFGSDVPGWRLGSDRDRDGYAIYRRAGHGWHRVDGRAIKIAGSPSNPWVINANNRIYHWTGRDWNRMPSRAIDIADGWALGLELESGGYAIYSWNGRDWDHAPGGAVEIGGSYERPWVINNRGEHFVWNGRDWDRARGFSYNNRRSTSGKSFSRLGDRRCDDRDHDYSRSSDRRRSDW